MCVCARVDCCLCVCGHVCVGVCVHVCICVCILSQMSNRQSCTVSHCCATASLIPMPGVLQALVNAAAADHLPGDQSARGGELNDLRLGAAMLLLSARDTVNASTAAEKVVCAVQSVLSRPAVPSTAFLDLALAVLDNPDVLKVSSLSCVWGVCCVFCVYVWGVLGVCMQGVFKHMRKAMCVRKIDRESET
jgi:hypothetical protein